MTDIQKYARESVDEYTEVTVEWRRMRLRAFIEQAYRFGLEDGGKSEDQSEDHAGSTFFQGGDEGEKR